MTVRDYKPAPKPVDWSALQYRPSPTAAVLTCRCGAVYVDDEPSREAHRIVFGHTPPGKRPETR